MTCTKYVAVTSLWLWCGLAGACQHEAALGTGTDTRTPQREAEAQPPAAPATKQPKQPAPGAPSARACSSDADCRSVDWYCDSCQCLPLATNAAPPSCPDGHQVQCFVAPCRGQRAVCKGGNCALEGASAQ